tara:strand:- start:84 stop:344 length:261 start_codon:yes stop_codon:yes gene_type:complete
MPKNPLNRVFLHASKRPHLALGLIISHPGKWGKMSLARKKGWDVYDFKKTVRKLERKGLIESRGSKLYPTDLGLSVYRDTLLHRLR